MQQFSNFYLVKYTAEIGTKKRSTRLKFIQKLKLNISEALKSFFDNEQSFSISSDWNHIMIESTGEIDEMLCNIPGIKYFTPAVKFPFHSVEESIRKAEDHFKSDVEKAGTFAVRARKSRRPDISARNFEIDLGTALNKYASVDLSNPAITCRVEIRGDEVFCFHEKKPGMQGLPLGIEGKTLTLLAGGFDSPVASWYIYKTGMDQDFVYFDLDGMNVVKNAVYPIATKLRNQYGHGSKGKFIEVDFLPVIQEIMKVEGSFRNLVLKYCFYQAAERLSRIKYAEAIVTGESIGQVSTQTLKNLKVLDATCPKLIIRPLAVFSKDEIQAKAKEIGTHDLAYKGPEYCALEAKQVETGTSPKKLEKEIAKLDLSVLETAIENRIERPIESLPEQIDENQSGIKKSSNETSNNSFSKENTEIIDLRTEEQAQETPYPGAKVIPFQQAWDDFINWDAGKKYFLLCEAGSKSKILANFMNEQSFHAEHLEGGIRKWIKSES